MIAAAAGLATALAGWMLAGSDADAQGPAPAPNIVVVQTDDQTKDSMRYMDVVRQRIGEAGTTFGNEITNWPVCCPSRATLLSGQYAHNHGVLGNKPPLGGVRRFDDANALPVWLEEADYATAHIGKYMNGYAKGGGQGPGNPRYVPPGWSEWHTATGDAQKVYDYTLNRNGRLVEYGSRPRDFKQDVFSDIAVQMIERHVSSADPLYLQVDYTAPHGAGKGPNPQPPGNCNRTAVPAPRHAHVLDGEPLPKGPSFNEADVSDKPADIRQLPRLRAADIKEIARAYRCRGESLLSVDEGVDRILDALADQGELGDTLVIFTSDNGYFHGEHRVPEGKSRVYQPASNVPLMLRGPGIPVDVQVARPVTNANLAPTVVDAAGASAGLATDGASLLDLLADQAGTPRRSLLIQAKPYTAVRTSRYVWVEHRTGERELYDLDEDPDELESRHADPDYAAARTALAERLATLRTCAGATCAVADYTDGP